MRPMALPQPMRPLLLPADRRLRGAGHVGHGNERRRNADAEALGQSSYDRGGLPPHGKLVDLATFEMVICS